MSFFLDRKSQIVYPTQIAGISIPAEDFSVDNQSLIYDSSQNKFVHKVVVNLDSITSITTERDLQGTLKIGNNGSIISKLVVRDIASAVNIPADDSYEETDSIFIGPDDDINLTLETTPVNSRPIGDINSNPNDIVWAAYNAIGGDTITNVTAHILNITSS